MTEFFSKIHRLFQAESNQPTELQVQMAQLRTQVHADVEEALQHRIATDPTPTPQEYNLGCFTEALEPQVQDAVLELNNKGYSTNASGFWGEHSDQQVIEGAFILDEETIRALQTNATNVEKTSLWGEPGTTISFIPQSTDLKAMKQKWDIIASLLPDTGKPAAPSTNDGSERFRQRYIQT